MPTARSEDGRHNVSYDISYRRQAFVLQAKQAGTYENLFFLLEEARSNNCYEHNNRRRSRSWSCLAAGADWECLAEVTRCAASCCGGSLVIEGRRRTEPETYIRVWRKVIAAAAPLEDAGRMGFSLEPFTRITLEEARGNRQYAFEALSKQMLVLQKEYTDPYNGTKAMEWRFSTSVPEQVKLWLDTRVRGRGFKSVEADGPDR
jgi:hypothetical protein